MKENWTRKSWSNCVKNRLRQNQLDPRIYFCRHTFSLSLLLSIVLLTRASSSSPNNCSLTETVSYLSRDAQDACTMIAPMQSHTRVSWGSAVIGRRNSCWGLSLDEAWGGRSDNRNEERGRKSATKIRRIEWTPNNELKRNRGKLENILSVLILVVVAVMRQRTLRANSLLCLSSHFSNLTSTNPLYLIYFEINVHINNYGGCSMNYVVCKMYKCICQDIWKTLPLFVYTTTSRSLLLVQNLGPLQEIDTPITIWG